MRMEEGLDTGDVLLEEKIKIEDNDNLISLTEKLSKLSAKLFMAAISKLEINMDKNINSFLTKQISLGREIKYARMIKKEDYKIDWGNNPIEISRKIKGLYPRANTTFRGKNLKIIKIRILRSSEFTNKNNNFNNNLLKPGTIIGIKENEGIVISTKTNPIIVIEAKLEGKNISSKMQLIQQLQPIVGEKFSD